jgi:L-lactate permease
MTMSMTGSFALSLLGLLLPATEAVEITAEPAHHLALANEQVRVFQVEVAPRVLFPFFSPLLGWLGVALTGSDTSSNVLSGGLQRVSAERLGLSPRRANPLWPSEDPQPLWR